MTLTIKNSPELNSPGKPGAPSQNSENKSGQSPRSNPVCLEVSITIRSLPNEAGGLAQPIREEGRTVIVFDNGAVVRSTANMPIGLKVILSNPKGREVVCRVAGGRNLPSVKGYVEVEFIEPVNDFWGIHQDVDPVAVTAPPVAAHAPREAEVPSSPVLSKPPRLAAPMETPPKPASVSLGSAPTFEDVPGLVSKPPSAVPPESKTEPAKPAPEMMVKDASNYNLSEIAKPTSLANWNPSSPQPPAAKSTIPAKREASSIISPIPTSTSAPSRDFMSKGLMAYDQSNSSSSPSNGRTPLIVGVAALALAGVCAVVFFMHRDTAPVSVETTTNVSQPSTPEPAPNSAPEPAPASQKESAPVAAQNSALPVAVEHAQPLSDVAPIPAVLTSPANAGTRPEAKPETRNVRQQEKNAVVTRQPDLSSSRRPVIPNLKMGSPSTSNQNLAKLGEGAAPITDASSREAVGGVPPAGLLTSAGRTSNPPAPPPSALAPAVLSPSAPTPSALAPSAPAPVASAKTVRDPKLISSTRLSYPAAAKQSNIQGIVTVSVNIDANGNVVGANALSGPMILRQAAMDSVKLWKYSPGLMDGKPAPSQVTVNVEFRLR